MQFLGVDYIVGKSESSKNATIRIPITNIAMIMEYESKEAWAKAVNAFEKQWGKK